MHVESWLEINMQERCHSAMWPSAFTGDVQHSHAANLRKQLSADFSKKLDMFKQQSASPASNKVGSIAVMVMVKSPEVYQPLYEQAIKLSLMM